MFVGTLMQGLGLWLSYYALQLGGAYCTQAFDRFMPNGTAATEGAGIPRHDHWAWGSCGQLQHINRHYCAAHCGVNAAQPRPVCCHFEDPTQGCECGAGPSPSSVLLLVLSRIIYNCSSTLAGVPFGAIGFETVSPRQRGPMIAIGSIVGGAMTLIGWGLAFLVGARFSTGNSVGNLIASSSVLS
eukprot:SAG31_NODE_7297_length_1728_cov_1.027010_1_plen_184_part_10